MLDMESILNTFPKTFTNSQKFVRLESFDSETSLPFYFISSWSIPVSRTFSSTQMIRRAMRSEQISISAKLDGDIMLPRDVFAPIACASARQFSTLAIAL